MFVNGFDTEKSKVKSGTYFIDGLVATEINTSTLSAGVHTLTYELNPPETIELVTLK